MPRNRKHIRLRNHDYRFGTYFVTICCRDRMPFFGDIMAGAMHLNAIGEYATQSWLEIPAHFPHVSLDEFVIMPNHMHGILHLRRADLDGARETDSAADFPIKSLDLAPELGSDMGPDVGPDVGQTVGSRHVVTLRFDPPDRPQAAPRHDQRFDPLDRPQTAPRHDQRSESPDGLWVAPAPSRSAAFDIAMGESHSNRFGPLPIGSLSVILGQFKATVTRWARKNHHPDFEWQRKFHDRLVRDLDELMRIRQYIVNNPKNWDSDDLNG